MEEDFDEMIDDISFTEGYEEIIKDEEKNTSQEK